MSNLIEKQKLSIPHAGIYKRGASPSNYPQTFLPTVPDLGKIIQRSNNTFTVLLHCAKGYQNNSTGSCDKLFRKSRVQVGATNRWRLSPDTGFDLLATSQLLKATQPVRKPKESYFSSIPSYSTIVPENSNVSKVDSLRTEKSMYSTTSNKKLDRSLLFLSKKTSQVLLERQINEMRLYGNYVPLDRRVPTPNEIFIKTVEEYHNKSRADIILYALNVEWELCEEAIEGSEILSKLLHDFNNSTSKVTCDRSNSHTDFIETSQFSMYCPYVDDDGRICLSLKINNPLISVEVFSIALLSLYKDIRVIPPEDVINILIVAQLLKIPKLIQLCVDVMSETIKINTVALYHKVAKEYGIEEVANECVSWLEVKLVPLLANEIYLGHLTKELMLDILSSPRFFTFNEFSLVKMLCNWVFFLEQKNTVMPSWTTVVTWFMSIPKSKPFLLTNEGKCYLPHFKMVRLNGITDPSNVHEIQKMDILPPHWLLSVLQNHYYSLQSGGDMNLMTRFDNGSMRYGVILKRNMSCHSEVIALHGFYFELIATRDDGACTCFLKRLRPTSSLLSFRICERQTFSIRQDREVRYNLKIQWKSRTGFCIESLGPSTQIIGFSERTSESQKLTVKVPNTDLFISYALFFPPS